MSSLAAVTVEKDVTLGSIGRVCRPLLHHLLPRFLRLLPLTVVTSFAVGTFGDIVFPLARCSQGRFVEEIFQDKEGCRRVRLSIEGDEWKRVMDHCLGEII